MTSLWWYLGRSSGVIATVLIVLALIWGFRFSGRVTGNRCKPAWWLDLHTYLGGLAFAFSALHVAFIYKDNLSGIGLRQVFIPLTADGWRWGITCGVVAMYVFAAVVFTSWPRRIGSRRTWLAIHLLSVPGALMAGVHAWMVGSSQHDLWFQVLLLALVAAVTYPAILRMFTAMDRRAKRSRSGRISSPPTTAVGSGTQRLRGPAEHSDRERLASVGSP